MKCGIANRLPSLSVDHGKNLCFAKIRLTHSIKTKTQLQARFLFYCFPTPPQKATKKEGAPQIRIHCAVRIGAKTWFALARFQERGRHVFRRNRHYWSEHTRWEGSIGVKCY